MANTDQHNHGWRELIEGGNLTRLVLVSFGVWLHAADGLMVVTMMPAIIGDIGGARFISWTISLYEIGSIVAGASGAFLCVRYGLRAAMSGAALIYMIGCASSALAPEMWVMLVGRMAQGLGGGGLVALSFIAVSLLFSRSVMPRVMAAVSALWGVSAFIGPLVGGVFADLGMWRGGFWFFAVQAAILAMVIGLSSAMSSQDAENEVKAAGKPPLLRLAILSLGVLAVAWSGIEVSPLPNPAVHPCGSSAAWAVPAHGPTSR
ncbi:MAG: MFS transporter [Rhizobiaceae bacterium]